MRWWCTAGAAAAAALTLGLLPAAADAPGCGSSPTRLDYAVLASLPDSATLLAVWASAPGSRATR